MELRGCNTTHYIQAIRGGEVLRVRNIISHGRPVIRSKILKDVYESEDANRIQKPSSGLVFDHQQVKDEVLYFQVADRTLREIKPEAEELAPRGDDELSGGLDDDTTLKQLKKLLLTKKRKRVSKDENLHWDIAHEKAVEDESDLNEPLIYWKPRHSRISKAKRKCLKTHVTSSSTIDVAIKSEENLVSECSSHVGGGPASVTRVKLEVPDAEQLECQHRISSGDASSIGHNEVPNPGQNVILNECNAEPLLGVSTYGNCATNEISYDHLEDVQPISILFPWVGTSLKLETPVSACRESPDFPSVEIEKQRETPAHPCRQSLPEDPNPDPCSDSRYSSDREDMPEERSIGGTQVPDMAVIGPMGLHQECNSVLSEDKTVVDFPYEPNDSLTSLDKNCGSDLDSIAPSNQTFMEDTISDKDQPSTCSSKSNELNSEGHIDNESLKAVDNQNSAFKVTGAESEASLETGTCDSVETTLIREPHQPPERLPSARKAFSPSSQEQLRMAMDSDEICNNSNQNIVLECKEKLFVNQTEKNGSSPRSNIQNGQVSVNHRCSGQVSQRKVTISPRRTIRKSQIAKGNLEGPRFSRVLPNVSTACTSVQGCSEGAIAFSQRQIHDMEMLAEKLMGELKSMKGIVEQKLLFESYRNPSVRNDADEVKSAISSATKVEESAKRWISMMARDCSRFCKIMKMTTDSTSASKDTVSREKKIMFADEAGGELCHIKFFNNSAAAPESESDAVKQ